MMKSLLFMACCALAACGDLPAQGQLVLYVDTDAILPPEPGVVPAAGEPAPLFDSLSVQIFEPGQAQPCDGCERVFPLDRGVLARLEASFGVPAVVGVAGYRARIRLFDSRATLSGTVPEQRADASEPSASVVDAFVALPMVEPEVVHRHTVVLRTDDVGTPMGSLDAPVAVQVGQPEASLVGTWPGARRIGCADAPPEGQVCVAGGAFWMGNPRGRGNGVGDASFERRLVVVSPFFVDAHEVTVAEYRAWPGHDDDFLQRRAGGTSALVWQNLCSFTDDAEAPFDAWPVVCVGFAGARAYCQSRGADLPTEAQFEYVAGALESRLYVWGSEEPGCDDAVLNRFDPGGFASPGQGFEPCPVEQLPGGPETNGSLIDPPRLDRLVLAQGAVYDLVGNAAEWVLDAWNRQTEPCWSSGGVYRDPLCTAPSIDGVARVFRGGSWIIGPRQAIAAYRGGPLTDAGVAAGQGIDLGFRCVRPATPLP